MAAAGQAGQATFAEGGDAYHGGVRPQGASTAGDGCMGDVAGCRGGGQGRAELMEVLAAFQVDELGQCEPGSLDRLGRGARDGEEEGPIGFGDLTVVVPVHDDRSDGVVRDDQGDDGEGPEPGRAEGRGDVGALPLQVVDGLREEGDVVAQNRAVDLQRVQHPVGGVVGGVAEAAQRPEDAPIVEESERRGVDAQLVAQCGEDGVGHLGRVGCSGQCPRHGLHALRRLGGDAPPSFVSGLGAGGPELQVPFPAQV